MGAISSGQTTCCLLIGSSVANGFQCGQGKEGVPQEHEVDRNRTIDVVGELYRDFLKEFGSTECKVLCHSDFSNPEDVNQYIQKKVWKNSCDVFLDFVIKKCIKLLPRS